MMKRFRTVWFLVLLFLLVYALAVHFSELQKIIALFEKAQPIWVAVALFLQAGTYLATAHAYHDIVKTMELKVSMNVLLKLTFAMLFLTHILPIGGFSGSVYFTRVLKRLGLSQGQGAAASIIAIVTGYLGFFAVLLISFVGLTIFRIQYAIPWHAIEIIVAGILLLFLLIDRLIVYREKLNHLAEHVLEVFRITQRYYLILDRCATFMEDVAEGRRMFLASKRKFIRPAIFQAAVLLFDALTILAIFFAFGQRASFFVILVSYSLARFLGAISLLPGGVGSFEVAQIITMKALGIPLATATVVTLFFRLFSFWLPIPLGLYFYRQLEKNRSVEM